MCLILFAFKQHADYPLIVIANRDEYYARPSENARWWAQQPDIFAGRDLQAGGTWLGVNRAGRFAAVTNVREPGSMSPGARSRGELTSRFLGAEQSAEDYLAELQARKQDYSGFNLLLGDRDQLWFGSNREEGLRRIEPGVYGISNGGFDEAWPKLSSGRQALAKLLDEAIDENRLMGILSDNDIAADHELPRTGVSLDIERMLSSRFIRSPEYGTRACSVVMMNRQDQVHFCEHNYIDSQRRGEQVRETFEVKRK